MLSFLYGLSLTSIHDYTVNYYSVVRKKEIILFVTIWVDFEDTVLTEIYQTEKDKHCIVINYLWVGKVLWRMKWLPTPVFLPGKSHGQRSLAGYSPQGHKELDVTVFSNTICSLCVSCITYKWHLFKNKRKTQRS